ncbi:ATP-binding protein [Candidatus Chloroploca asiatica]|uniref:Bacterial transcriptional activator domain-containing protein n=1 Tax=Candidatus Chloroploca asiatica TaxID=1506545 RepID=A0A2H3KZF2_9CHLR|nr:BTAD domain-containing putative transcriptional regulator [Candidatus Chloroploca asiatica]PDV97739.1 hypothetical protein A9Q02_17770 [Candidatus Chloroploca asiatica]
MTVMLNLELFGHTRITYGGKQVTGFVSNKAEALLCYLAITGEAHSRDDLAALLWSEMPEAEAKANLRVVLCNLRQLFPEHMQINRKTVALRTDEACWIDALLFQRSVQTYDATRSDAMSVLRDVVALYHGDLLHGLQPRGALLFEEWLLLQREHMRQLMMQSCYALAQYHMQCAEYTEALHYTIRLLKLEPWHEEAHRYAMLLLALSGQRSASLAQYKTCEQILGRELGIEPEEETKSLYHRILAGEVTPAPARRPLTMTASAPRLLPLPFVGRGADFLWLREQYDLVQRGCGRFTLIHGVAGIGKTCLVEQFLHFISGTGSLVLRARCERFHQAVPFQPVVDVLRAGFQTNPELFQHLPEHWQLALRQLLPEMRALTPGVPEAYTMVPVFERQALFEAVSVCFAELERHYGEVVLWFDDLHYADGATIDLLNYLTRHCQQARIWYLGAYRSELLDVAHPLQHLASRLRRSDGLAVCELGLLHEGAIKKLVESLPGLDATARTLLAATLAEVSGGNPFLLSQVVTQLVEHKILVRHNEGWFLHPQQLVHAQEYISPELQALLMEQVGRLPDEAQRLLQLAAVSGQSFSLSLMAKAFESDHHAIMRMMQPLLAFDLVREVPTVALMQEGLTQGEVEWMEYVGNVRYTFASPLIWRAIVQSLPPGDRRRLAEQVAQAHRIAPRFIRTPILAHQHQTLRTTNHNRRTIMALPKDLKVFGE